MVTTQHVSSRKNHLLFSEYHS